MDSRVRAGNFPKTLGRYELLKPLGSGAQGSVYLAKDPELDRRVAIKILRAEGATGTSADKERFHEARMVSRLQHTGIVTLHDVGLHAGAPYLVFEYIPGQALHAVLAQRSLTMAEILDATQVIVSAVAEAHGHGIVHRDLKPSNIMLGEDGVPKVMDFGIAQAADLSEVSVLDDTGLPHYLAPESIRDGIRNAATDVFALGVIAFEMVAGYPAFAGDSRREVADAVLNRALPDLRAMRPEVHELFEAWIRKATEKNPATRFGHAGEMLESLRDYRQSMTPSPDSAVVSGNATMQFLIGRMHRHNDFPALSSAISALNRLVTVDDEDIAPLAQLIVKDYGLTSKILKIVNSAYYNRFAGTVTTVSRAIIVLGTKAIRSIAASLIFFEHLDNRGRAEHLRDRVAVSLFDAIVARRLAEAGGSEDAEEFLLCGMLHRLGELLVTFYLPDEALEIDRLVEEEQVPEETAQSRVLGAHYTEIGIHIAREWNFPEQTVRSMRPLQLDAALSNPQTVDPFQRVASLGHDLVSAVSGAIEGDSGVAAVLEDYGELVGMEPDAVEELLADAVREFLALTREWGRAGGRVPLVAALERRLGAGDPVSGTDTVLDDSESGASAPDPGSEGILAHGLQEVTELLLDRCPLAQVFNLVVETMYRAMDFRRVVLCLRDTRSSAMIAKLGFGEDIQAFMREFRFSLGGDLDPMTRAVTEGEDVHLEKADGTGLAERLPSWFAGLNVTGSALMLPIRAGGRVMGLVYADWPYPAVIPLTAVRLDLLMALRSQAAMAIQLSVNPDRGLRAPRRQSPPSASARPAAG